MQTMLSVYCLVCMTDQPIEWIGCDLCSNWFHYACLSGEKQTEVDLSLVTGNVWVCGHCIIEE